MGFSFFRVLLWRFSFYLLVVYGDFQLPQYCLYISHQLGTSRQLLVETFLDGNIYDEFLDQNMDDDTIAFHIFELTMNGSDEDDFQADIVNPGGRYRDVSF